MTGERQVIFSGQEFSLKGEKGRFVLPSGFRKTVAHASDGKTLCLDKHHRWNCLVGFGLSRESDLEAQLEKEEERAIRLGQHDFDSDRRRIQLFGFARLPFDDSGRFVMPQHLADIGCLANEVFFHGAGTFFTLWNPDELYRMGEGWEAAQAACRALAAESKGKKG
ncbi:MAG: division/cell wall cluster transcriptional repressor MraZ [Candidatus Andeanibacterium colombiense]|uniref:Division/cell wall cluster transcriptional repressor MraZ n=1 Tax=Candidatus Andeanibacterium colombiense TaxID=3121345 RepID=A0AAJ6BQT3_9SPHN|nr:MAG: division/cell wall cluster transcriptional repressor MraZ [Sphingomonadaceae bacterium]